MNINQLIDIVKIKLKNNIDCDKIEIEDKTFLHKNHKTHEKKKFHIKIIITSEYLKKKIKFNQIRKFIKY
tara:strand:- start:136 stop:345 length:210 start_codon:yes stop_codon:yes gene_type:complete